MMPVRRTALVMLVLAGLIGACTRAPATEEPIGPPGDSGSPRIATLSPALGVIVRDLGLALAAVARDGYDAVLPRHLPVCGDLAGIDYEVLLRVRPTHVLLQWGARPHPARLIELAKAHGWMVRDYDLRSLADIRAATTELGQVFGVEAQARALMRRMDDALRPRASVFAGRVLLLESVSPPAALGPGSFHHEILVMLGGRPVLVVGAPFVRLDAEDVSRLAPEGMILFAPRSPEGSSASEVRRRSGAASAEPRRFARLGALDIPAVRAGRLAVVDDPLSLTPGTCVIDLAERLGEILEQWGSAAGDDPGDG